MKAPTVAWCTAWLLLFGHPAAADEPGFDFRQVPTNLRPSTPRASWFGIAPTGPGYYSALDWFRGECRPAAPQYPFPPTVNASLSAFDLDTRYLDAPDFPKEWPDQLKRVRLGDHWMLSTGGQAWLRYENHTDTRLGTRDNIFLLDRARPYVDLWYEDRVRVFVEGMFAASNWQDLPPVANDVDHNDFQNLFAEVNLFTWEGHPVAARIGRQEVALGAQRLLATPDWVNARQTFDGVRLLRTGDQWSTDLFWLSPRVIRHPNRINSHDNNVNLFGAWATYRPQAGTTRDFFVVVHDNVNRIRAQGIELAPFTSVTLGNRMAGDLDGRWLYDLEIALQLGRRGAQDIVAGYTTVGLGYRWKEAPASPILWAYYDYASGDDTPNGGRVAGTFNRVYPFGHYYGGWIDVVGRQNIHDLSFASWLYPAHWISIWIQYHNFWLANRRDALYNAAGAPIRRDASGLSGDYVGQEIDVQINFHLTQRADIQFGYSHLWGGEYLRRTASDTRGVNASLCYLTYGYRW